MNWKKEFHPTCTEVDQWCADLIGAVQSVSVEGTLLEQTPITQPFGNSPNTLVNRYVRFTACWMAWAMNWQFPTTLSCVATRLALATVSVPSVSPTPK